MMLIVPTILVHLPFYGADDDTIGFFSIIVMIVQLIVLIVSILPTEKALKQNFNEDGTKRYKESTVESVMLLNRNCTHQMKLDSSPFEMIKAGTKTIELRLNDGKRQRIRVGDEIIFTSNATGELLSKRVAGMHRFDNFEELYRSLPLLECGYTDEDIDAASASDMEKYYSREDQERFGVVGIELGSEE